MADASVMQRARAQQQQQQQRAWPVSAAAAAALPHQRAFHQQPLPTVVIVDTELEGNRPGVFSPPPRPVHAAAQVASEAQSQQNMSLASEEHDDNEQDFEDDNDDEAFRSPITPVPFVDAPAGSSRARATSDPHASASHRRTRSHFSIPDVVVTSCEEEGHATHFEVQLEHAMRRMVLHSPMTASSSMSTLPSSSSIAPSVNTSSTSSPTSSPPRPPKRRAKKQKPPAILVVDDNGQSVNGLASLQQHPKSTQFGGRVDGSITAPIVPSSPTASTPTGNSFGQRLRKTSLPSLFGKKERDAAHVAATYALPPSPTTFVAPESMPRAPSPRSPSEPSPQAPRQQPRRPSEPLPGSRPQRAGMMDSAPSSPVDAMQPSSPLSAFFSNNNNSGRTSVSPTTASKKEIKQRQKEEKALMKELGKVDKMVRKHDEKALKAQKKAEKTMSKQQQSPSQTFTPIAPALRAPPPPPSSTVSAQEGRAKSALRRMTMFRANTSGTPRAAVPHRQPSVQRRSIVAQGAPASPPLRPMRPAPIEGAESRRPRSPPPSVRREVAPPAPPLPLRSTSDGEWADVPSSARSTSTFAHAIAASPVKEGENVSRSSSIKRALSARKRSSAGKAIRPGSSGTSRNGNRPGSKQGVSGMTSVAPLSVSNKTPTTEAPTQPSFARPRKTLLGETDEATKARYRIESFAMDSSDLGWEEELGLAAAVAGGEQTTPCGSGQVTPRTTVVSSRPPQLTLRDSVILPNTSAVPASPPAALSLFESLYKEVDAMESSFGKAYPVEAEVRRKSISQAKRVTMTTPLVSSPTISEPAEQQKGWDTRSSSSSTGDDEGARRERTGSTASSCATSSTASSNAVPETPPLPSGFAASYRQAVCVTDEAEAADVSKPTAQQSPPSISVQPAAPSDAPSAVTPSVLKAVPAPNGSMRRIRVGANPKGFRFPPTHAQSTTSSSDPSIVRQAIGGASPIVPRSNSSPHAL